MKPIFQPLDGVWSEHAKLGVLRSVLDPKNQDNRKNKYIDHIHRHVIRSIFPAITGRRVLDFGCGSGRFSRMLSGHAQKIICVDVTREMLSLAARENRMDNMCYLMIDGINLPVKGCSVNSILSVCVLQYAARNQDIYRSIMSEFKRVLKPGGSIFALEQVSFADAGQLLPECSLRIKDYLGEMEKYFHIKHAHPVRGARKRSFFEKLAIKYRLPEALFPLLTWMDINRTKKLTPAQLAQYPYVDYFFYGVLKG